MLKLQGCRALGFRVYRVQGFEVWGILGLGVVGFENNPPKRKHLNPEPQTPEPLCPQAEVVLGGPWGLSKYIGSSRGYIGCRV